MFALPRDPRPEHELFPSSIASPPGPHHVSPVPDPLRDMDIEEIFPSGPDSIPPNQGQELDFPDPFSYFDENAPEVPDDDGIPVPLSSAECQAPTNGVVEQRSEEQVDAITNDQTARKEIRGAVNLSDNGNDLGHGSFKKDENCKDLKFDIGQALLDLERLQGSHEDGAHAGTWAIQSMDLEAELNSVPISSIPIVEEHEAQLGTESGDIVDSAPNLDQDRDEEPVIVQLPADFLTGEWSGGDRNEEAGENGELGRAGFNCKHEGSFAGDEKRTAGLFDSDEEFGAFLMDDDTNEQMGTDGAYTSIPKRMEFVDSILQEEVGKEVEDALGTEHNDESKLEEKIVPVLRRRGRFRNEKVRSTAGRAEKKRTAVGQGTGGEGVGRVEESRGKGGRRQKKKRTRVEDLDPALVYVCPVEDCKKKFAKKYNLKIHERRHRGDLPFICPKCSKKFMWQSSFERHLRVHSSRESGFLGRSGQGRESKSESEGKQCKFYDIERICNTVSNLSLHGHLLTVNHLEPSSAMLAGSLAILNGVGREDCERLLVGEAEDVTDWKTKKRQRGESAGDGA